MDTNLPGNSNTGGSPTPPSGASGPKHIPKLGTSGDVVLRKKSLGTKIKETFFGRSAKDAVVSTVNETVVPGFKDLIYDAIDGAVQRRLFGEVRGSGRRNSSITSPIVGGIFGNAGYQAYAKMSSSIRQDPREQQAQQMQGRQRVTRRDLQEIILPGLGECNEVVDLMNQVIHQYGSCTLPDLWEILEVTGEWTDDNWGWVEQFPLQTSRITHQGQTLYQLHLPPPMYLPR